MSLGSMAAPHRGQREVGQTMDCRRGTRWITTFRKLPTTRPRRPVTTTITLRLRAVRTYFPLPDGALPGRLEPGRREPTGRRALGHPDGEDLMFERYIPSVVASFATTFYFPPGRSREAKDLPSCGRRETLILHVEPRRYNDQGRPDQLELGLRVARGEA